MRICIMKNWSDAQGQASKDINQMGSGDAEFPSGWKTSYPCKIFIVVADVLRPDILPQLKHVGFSLLLSFRLHPSLSWQFCVNPLPSSGVFPVLKVAPLWVSLIHMHASLSACNLDIPSARSSVKTAERRHSQPHAEGLPDQSLHGDFHAWISMPLRDI